MDNGDPDRHAHVPSGPLAGLPPGLPRSQGRAVLAYEAGRLQALYQQGCLKILLPRFGREAVLVNTAGGLTGGDRLALELRLGAGEVATLTTQAAERIYRADAGFVRLDQQLRLGAGAQLDWLPQECILFNGAALERRLEVDLAAGARFLGLETYIFGRVAHGEVMDRLHLRDHWRIRRDGRLIHAEALRLDGMPAGKASLSGCRAVATLVLAAPGAVDLLQPLRALLAQGPAPGGCEAAASAPLPDLVLLRFMAATGQALRQSLIPVVMFLRGGTVPRVWQF